MTRRGLLLSVLVLLCACETRVPALDPAAPLRIESAITFDDTHSLELHLSRPCDLDPMHPLILYATGDGGWRGKDEEAFERMTRWGYPLVGFSSPVYLRHIVRHMHEATPSDVARDYARIIRIAKARMSLPDEMRTVLLGVSRGSGLAVAAAGEPGFQPLLVGVVAVALTREEEYVHRLRRSRKTPQEPPEMVMLDNYEYLPRLRSLPLSIIQSVHDNYLPAEEARRLLGPDSTLHQLHPIASKNHSFTDARDALYAQMKSSLEWVCQLGVRP
ncbi:MAG TPA: AcvB/VirJ family lysyl-phosphatidylglycerol hydrolase [Vicinamibacterales bacterium]|nr:AcvB/VirJ family lysyl-phosphatidylglycerol hydrolase [Vicinamibacterales bacterium]